MTSARRSLGALLALLVASAPVYPQSLGDLARQEEARRSTAQKAKRSFSDGDLAPRAISAATETSQSCYMSVSVGRCLTADEILAKSLANIPGAEKAKLEPIYRDEASAIRSQLAVVEQEMNALAVTAEDETRPAARRAAAASALAKRRTILAHLQQGWARLEKTVEQQRIPHRWIEPVPEFASRNPH